MKENKQYMICNICKQKVKVRKVGTYGLPFPEQHPRSDRNQVCHGFFVEGQFAKEGV